MFLSNLFSWCTSGECARSSTSINLSTYLSIYISIYLVNVQAESVQGAQPALTYLSVYLSIYLSIYLVEVQAESVQGAQPGPQAAQISQFKGQIGISVINQ